MKNKDPGKNRIAEASVLPYNADQIRLLNTSLSRLNDIVMITEAEPVDDPGPRIIYVNDAFVRRTGYSRDEVIGKTPRILHGPKTQRHELDRIRAALQQWQPVRAELINYTKSGEEFWLEINIDPVADETGRFTHWVAIERDVTDRKQKEDALRESEIRFKNAARAASDAIWDWDLKTNSLWWGDGMKNLFGFDPDEMESSIESWISRLHPADRERVVAGIHRIIDNGGEYWRDEYHFLRKNGSYAYVMDRGFVIRDEQGNAVRMVGGITDLTAQKEAQDKILRLNRVYRMLSKINALITNTHSRKDLFDGACRIAVEEGEFRLAWIGVVEDDGKTLSPQAWAGHNNGYLQCLDLSTEAPDDISSASSQAIRLKRRVVFDINNLDDKIHWKKEALKRGYQSILALPVMVKGEVAGVMSLYVSGPDYFDDKEIKLLTDFSDHLAYALQNIAQQEKLDYLASYDQLTGLPNRLLFHEHLNSILNEARNNDSGVALLIYDLKHFGEINNVYGRQIGDMVLQEIGIRLQELTSDTFNLGRITNDCFAMVLPAVDSMEKISALMENSLLPFLQRPVVVANTEIQLGFRAGIAVAAGNRQPDADTLYRNAGIALKKAKMSGEPYLFYRPEMTTRIAENLQIKNKLQRALKENQFVLHYQPKIDAQTHKIIGLEALIRWNDPESGLVPPAKFIPLLEESGLILDVGVWAMKQALADSLLLQKKGLPPLRIAVNVSPLQLQQKNFAEIVTDVITRHGDDTRILDMEVTESLLMQDIEGSINKLAAIRELGVNISIDDFGTGYSSLGYLTKLPVHALKIDRSFIMSMTSQPESMTIVSTIITLAHSLDLRVIAEGVETEEQAKLLRLLKCDEMQGYLFSKPLPPDAMFELLCSGKTL
jgi:PAS domain S-box-containing protein/diguanylate cyclase (GGDEF)-like protein